jgi:hypothetical protein
MGSVAALKYFHDGSIERVLGNVPGDVKLQVSIDYLREQFEGAPGSFTLLLQDCKRLQFEPFDQPATSHFDGLDIEILSVSSESPLEVMCTHGKLLVECSGLRVFLENGREVSLSDLASASDGYWDAWSRRSRGEA